MLDDFRHTLKMELFERPFQATKSNAATLFSERSKMKLDLARRLIKPELNIEGNEFDVTTTPYSGKSKVKEVTAVSESRKIEKTTKAANANDLRVLHGSLITDNEEKEKSRARARWKFLESRKSFKDRNLEILPKSPITTIRKSRVTTEKTSTFLPAEEISVKSTTESNIIPRGIMHRGTVSAEETTATTIDTTKIRSLAPQSTVALKEEVSTLVNTMKTIDNNIVTTIIPIKLDKISTEISESEQGHNDVFDAQRKTTTMTTDVTSIRDTSEFVKIYTTEFPQEITLSPSITTLRNTYSPAIVTPEKVYPVYVPEAKTGIKEKAKVSDATKNAFRPRYTKQEQDKVAVSMVISRTVGPTSRYIRKKSGVFTPYDAIPKSASTEPSLTQTKRREFRPRTATYRRHSEMPTSQLIQGITATKGEMADITITPKPTKYHAQIDTTSTRFEAPASVTIDTSNDTTPIVLGITDSNNNSGSNIFSPTRSTFLSANTNTLLEQLRSTVAPLLNTLGDKTPVFSGAYSNVNIGVSN